MSSKKHLELSSRILIEDGLNKRLPVSAIASSVGKHPTTVAREIKQHSYKYRSRSLRFNYNSCAHRYDCTRKNVCAVCNTDKYYKYCRNCGLCNGSCPEFKKARCRRLERSPFVCNGCDKRRECSLEKVFYKAEYAQRDYEKLRSEARSGISFSEDELAELDALITPLVENNHSPHHICVNNKDSIMVSERTIYRLIDAGAISAKNIDLPRKVRFKPRKKKRVFKVDKKCRIGRTFEDFNSFLDEHPDIPVTQIDSVEGKKGGNVLLTIHFVKAECMFAFIRDHNDSSSVIKIFNMLDDLFGRELFEKIFRVLLADNGSEFSNPAKIECDEGGALRTRLFYCDPQASYQKGSAERNHEFIRMFIPKGKSLDGFTQADISLMMDHINSYTRESLGDRSPYDMFEFLYGSEALDLLGCHRISPNDVTLNRSIFRKESNNGIR